MSMPTVGDVAPDVDHAVADGRIARAWPAVKPEGHAGEVLAALGEARASA